MATITCLVNAQFHSHMEIIKNLNSCKWIPECNNAIDSYVCKISVPNFSFVINTKLLWPNRKFWSHQNSQKWPNRNFSYNKILKNGQTETSVTTKFLKVAKMKISVITKVSKVAKPKYCLQQNSRKWPN